MPGRFLKPSLPMSGNESNLGKTRWEKRFADFGRRPNGEPKAQPSRHPQSLTQWSSGRPNRPRLRESLIRAQVPGDTS